MQCAACGLAPCSRLHHLHTAAAFAPFLLELQEAGLRLPLQRSKLLHILPDAFQALCNLLADPATPGLAVRTTFSIEPCLHQTEQQYVQQEMTDVLPSSPKRARQGMEQAPPSSGMLGVLC